MRENRRTPSHDDACYTCHSQSSSELIKTFGISSSERGGRRRGQALERKPSNAWARKMPALNRPKNAVTVSIIAKSFALRPQHNDTAPRTVKRIPRWNRKSGQSDALAQQFRRGGELGECGGNWNWGCAIARFARSHSPKAAFPPPKIKRRINRDKALRYQALGVRGDVQNRR